MKGLVIGASAESVYAITLAKSMGIETVAIDGNENAVGLQYADNSEVIDISHPEKVIKYCAGKDIGFTIPVPIGRWLTTTGAVNDYFHLKGVSQESVRKSVDKWSFHLSLNKAGLRNINARLVEKGRMKPEKYWKFPVIVKPRYGSGNKGIKIIEKIEDFTKVQRMGLLYENDIVEELVEGTEYGIDACVYDGNLKIILIRKKILSAYPSMQAVGYLSDFDKNTYEKVFNTLENAKFILNYNNCLLHADIIIRGDEAFIVEMSPRPSGHHLHNNFTIKATNYNMLKAYYRYQLDGYIEQSNNTNKNLGIFFYDLPPGILRSMPDLKKYNSIIEYRCDLVVGTTLTRIETGADIMSRGYFIIDALSEDEIIETRNDILSTFKVEHV